MKMFVAGMMVTLGLISVALVGWMLMVNQPAFAVIAVSILCVVAFLCAAALFSVEQGSQAATIRNT